MKITHNYVEDAWRVSRKNTQLTCGNLMQNYDKKEANDITYTVPQTLVILTECVI